MAEQTEPLPRRRYKRVRKASRLLSVYRYVFKTDPPRTKADRMKEKPDVRTVRDIKERTPDKFIAKMQELEAHYQLSRGGDGEAAGMDEGSKKVLDLVEGLLDDLAEKRTQTAQPRPKSGSDRSPE